MKNFKSLAFISALLFLVCAAGQIGNAEVLRGQVTVGNQPVSDAVVSVFLLAAAGGYSRTIATKTDSSGNYRFDVLQKGEYIMLVSKGSTRLYQGRLLVGQQPETVKDVRL
jgi:hypothetical protein